MIMLVKDNNNRYLKVEDIDVVFTDNKSEAFNFHNMSTEDFSVLKEQHFLRVAYVETCQPA